MGKGDKETFAYAMLAVGEPVHIVSRPTEALGERGCAGDVCFNPLSDPT